MIGLKLVHCLFYATVAYLCYIRFSEGYEYMKRNWAEIPRGDKRAQWAGIYVTMNSKGMIVMNRAAHERMDLPTAFLLLYDRANNTIGLKPTSVSMRNGYPAHKSGRHGGRRVSAYRLLKEHGLVVKETLEFPDAEIDEDGILVLNLRTAKISNRALRHPRRRKNALIGV
jgi:hypothetical protein